MGWAPRLGSLDLQGSATSLWVSHQAVLVASAPIPFPTSFGEAGVRRALPGRGGQSQGLRFFRPRPNHLQRLGRPKSWPQGACRVWTQTDPSSHLRTSSEKSWGSAARLGHPGSGQTGEQVCLLQEEEGRHPAHEFAFKCCVHTFLQLLQKVP